MTKRVVLAVTGGIAAYKSAELLRCMTKAGWSVRVVMTEAATRFIGTTTMQALSGQPVFVDGFDNRQDDAMPHIALSKSVDAIVVAPATADTLARIAQGRADELVGALCLACACPIIVAPAMNGRMWAKPATRRNVDQLRADGVAVVGPAVGSLACGEAGDGRMVDVDDLFEAVSAALSPKPLIGARVLITAGPTVEPIDPVRAITNASSGKMGYQLARAAFAAGAQVTLISGPVALDCPYGVARQWVKTARDMEAAVLSHVDDCDLFISVAAVSDYAVDNAQTTKIKREDQEPLTLVLRPNADILAKTAALPNAPFCVGFAAETDHWIEHGQRKREKKGIPMIVVNDAVSAIGSDDNAVTVIDADTVTTLPAASKRALADELIALIADRFARAPHRNNNAC